MSLAKSIVKNTAWLTAAEIISTVLIGIGGVLLARTLGDVGYGQYGFALSFVSLFSIITEFGINMVFINEVSRDRTLLRSYFEQLLGLKIGLGLLFILLVAGFVQLTGKSADIKTIVYLLSISLAISALMTLGAAVFRINERMKYEAIFRVISSLASVSVVLWIVVRDLGYVRFVQLSIVANAAILIAYLAFIRRRYVAFRLTFDWSFIRRFFIRAMPLGLSTIFVSIYYNLDSVMLSFWKTDQLVGWYNADYKLILILLSFVNLYFAAIFPVLSRLIVASTDSARRIVQLSTKLMVLASVPVAAGVTVEAKPLLKLFYGHEFAPGAPALTVLIWTVTLYSLSAVYGHTLIAAAKRTQYMWGVAFGALANVIFNFLLIPPFSAVGAAVATVIAQLVVLAYLYWATGRHVFSVPFGRSLVRPLIASAVMVGVLKVLPPLPVIMAVVIGAVVYAVSLLAVRGVTISELASIRTLFRKGPAAAGPNPSNQASEF